MDGLLCNFSPRVREGKVGCFNYLIGGDVLYVDLVFYVAP